MRTFFGVLAAVTIACGGKIEDTTPPPQLAADGTRICSELYLACDTGDACTEKMGTCELSCRCENARWKCESAVSCLPSPDAGH